MNKIVILNNVHDKVSRDFVTAYGTGYQIIDWYNSDDILMQEYTARCLPSPSIFPCVVDTELKYISNCPATLQAGLDEITAYETGLVEKGKEAQRVVRNNLLIACDWIVLVDSPATEECVAAYKVYRQALRDIDFDNIVWPVEPAYVKRVA